MHACTAELGPERARLDDQHPDRDRADEHVWNDETASPALPSLREVLHDVCREGALTG